MAVWKQSLGNNGMVWSFIANFGKISAAFGRKKLRGHFRDHHGALQEEKNLSITSVKTKKLGHLDLLP